MATEQKQQQAADDEAAIRNGFEQFRLLAEVGPMDWPDLPDLRYLAKRLGVPYLLLLLENQSGFNDPYVTIDDLAEWQASPAAQRVLAETWAQDAADDTDDKTAVA